MQAFDFSEFTQNITRVFNTALIDEVVINYEDGNSYKLLPVKEDIKTGKSPFENIPRVKLNITTQEIADILRDCRAGI